MVRLVEFYIVFNNYDYYIIEMVRYRNILEINLIILYFRWENWSLEIYYLFKIIKLVSSKCKNIN